MSDQANGLRLTLNPRRAYKEGELPEFDAVITNVSNHPITFCRYLLEHRLLSTARLGEYECFPFGPTPRREIRADDYQVLQPGASLTINLPNADGRSFGWFYGGHLAPTLKAQDALSGFPAGEYTLHAHVGDFVSFYRSDPGQFSRERQRVHLHQEVPKQAQPPGEPWQGDLLASAPVRFG